MGMNRKQRRHLKALKGQYVKTGEEIQREYVTKCAELGNQHRILSRASKAIDDLEEQLSELERQADKYNTEQAKKQAIPQPIPQPVSVASVAKPIEAAPAATEPANGQENNVG